MKLPTSSGRLRKPKPLAIRRVIGDSMMPTLRPGQIVLATSLVRVRPGKLVIARHKGRELIKRATIINGQELYILGDNKHHSLDSRTFGWITKNSIVASVIWPRK